MLKHAENVQTCITANLWLLPKFLRGQHYGFERYFFMLCDTGMSYWYIEIDMFSCIDWVCMYMYKRDVHCSFRIRHSKFRIQVKGNWYNSYYRITKKPKKVAFYNNNKKQKKPQTHYSVYLTLLPWLYLIVSGGIIIPGISSLVCEMVIKIKKQINHTLQLPIIQTRIFTNMSIGIKLFLKWIWKLGVCELSSSSWRIAVNSDVVKSIFGNSDHDCVLHDIQRRQ